MTPRTLRHVVLLTLTIGIFAAPCSRVDAASANWKVDAAGNWNTDTNWTDAHPTLIDEVAGLNFNITAARIVTLDGPNTIGTLNIGDPTPTGASTFFGYSLNGTNTLTFDVTTGSAKVNKTSGNTDTINVPVQLNDNLVVSLAPAVGNITFNGIISGNVSLTRVGNNAIGTRLILGNAANSYTGDTIIGTGSGATDGGTLRATLNGAIPFGTGKGNVVIGPVGILEVTNATNTTLNINGLTGAAGSIVDLGVNGTNSTLAVGNNDATSTYAGIIRNTATGATTFNLTKVGLGTLTLSGANTYNGSTTVSAGTLLVNGTHTGGNNYNVNAGGKLGGTGTINLAATKQVLLSGGTLAPGASIGTLNVGGSVTMTSGSFEWEFSGGGTPPLGADVLNVNGALSIASVVTLSGANLGAIVANGTKLVAISYATVGAPGGFAGALDDTNIVIGGQEFFINYDDTNFAGAANFGQALYANAVTLTAVPEASSVIVLGLTCLVAFGAVSIGKRLGGALNV